MHGSGCERRRLAVAVGSLWLAGASLVGCQGDADEGALLTSAVQKGTVRRSVSATGTLRAVVTVQVGSQVTGVIQSLGADFNSVVRKDQVIARIDPANFQAQLERAEADLSASEARVRSAVAAVANQRANELAARANLEGAEAALKEARRLVERNQELAAGKVISSRDLEASESSAAQARARVAALSAHIDQSQAQLRAAEAGLEEARAQVAQSRAAVSVARVNLDHTVIASPIDGVVISRSVDVGQTVAASLQAPTLFVIVNDLAKMNVIASIDEADIGSISDSTDVSFTVDAFPGESFKGRINQVRLEPTTTQNVVTYSVMIDVDNPRLQLRPGMTASVTLTIAEQKDVLKVPNAALRFWPDDVPREKMAELLGQPPASAAAGAASPSPGAVGNASASTGVPVTTPGQVKAAVYPGTEPGAAGTGRAAELVARLRDPASSDADREAARDELRALPPGERAKLRELFGSFGGGGGRSQRRGNDGPTAEGSTASGQLRFPAPPPAEPRPRIVWIEAKGGAVEARRALVTITDGSATAVVGGDLAEGDKVVVGRNVAGRASATARPGANNPLAPQLGPGRR